MNSVSPQANICDEARQDANQCALTTDATTERHQKTTGSKRQKTFTGCWTCRERHVKCDEERPRCRRCTTGSFVCQGYGTRLTWLTPKSQKAQKSGDRSRSQAAEAISLSSVSGHSSKRGTSFTTDHPLRGSFSVFKASEPHLTLKRCRVSGQRARAAAEKAQDDIIANLENETPLFQGVICSSTIPSGSTEAIWQDQGIQELNLWPGETSRGSLEEAQHQSNWHTHLHRGSLSFDSLWFPQMGSNLKAFNMPSAPARETELINHWATNLAHKLIPIRSPANPFLTVVSPMTLEGSRLASTKSTCTVALFHAVCAISAAHQANLRSLPIEDKLVLYHKEMSFHHLMQNINCGEHDERMAALSTLCLWTLIHFITGTPGAWREVVKVTRNLLEETSTKIWNHSTTAALTYQSFASSFTLIQAQYLGRLEFLTPFKTSLPNVETPKNQIMPLRSLELISLFNTKLQRTHLLASEELDQLEMEFVLTTPEPSTSFDAANVDSALVHHHRSLFYHACLLYFRTNSGRRGSEEDIQGLVSRCLDHMEQLDSLQPNSNSTTWIFATVAFEAAIPELQDRIRYLFSQRKSLGFATWDTLLLAVEEAWVRRDASPFTLAPEPWTRFLAQRPQFDVVLY
ncbi:uncharacterized protein CTRU02_200920 [Colletotrichum truncatum]|uniref:Uncharacterized protein n=1 Tax=Colletotrichum truncatum TaxID=5467 RepID=A0ACC3ZFV5_COLTU|nr:uncharacterized protein CTRU02_00687 [Colletotrichum truncatum]KAF6801938.1 hypothetical protein CTRU02_00687 [Colletotrichum truncatum]